MRDFNMNGKLAENGFSAHIEVNRIMTNIEIQP